MSRLPIKVIKNEFGVCLIFADGAKVWVYGREDQVSARIANTLSMTDAEKLAKYIARTLTDAWGGRKLEPPDPDE